MSKNSCSHIPRLVCVCSPVITKPKKRERCPTSFGRRYLCSHCGCHTSSTSYGSPLASYVIHAEGPNFSEYENVEEVVRFLESAHVTSWVPALFLGLNTNKNNNTIHCSSSSHAQRCGDRRSGRIVKAERHGVLITIFPRDLLPRTDSTT